MWLVCTFVCPHLVKKGRSFTGEERRMAREDRVRKTREGRRSILTTNGISDLPHPSPLQSKLAKMKMDRALLCFVLLWGSALLFSSVAISAASLATHQTVLGSLAGGKVCEHSLPGRCLSHVQRKGGNDRGGEDGE